MMRLRWWKPRPVDPARDDVAEARELRAEAVNQHRQALVRRFAVAGLASSLVERRALNHFGDAIQITFTRRTGG